MGFVDNLRLNNIFPVNIGAPDMSATSGIPDMANVARQFSANIQPYLENQQYLQRAHQLQDRNSAVGLQRIADLNKGMAGGQGMNTVFKEDITPYQQGTLDFKNRALDTKTDLDKQKLGVQDENTDEANRIRQQRANDYSYKTHNPELKSVGVPGGDFMSFNPATGTYDDSGVSSGRMSDEDRMMSQFMNAMGLLKQRGQQGMDLQGLRNQGALDQIGERARTRPTPQPKTLLPTQDAALYRNNAMKLYNSNPELSQYIQHDELGNPMIKPNTPPDIRTKIQGLLNAGSTSPQGNAGGTTNPNDPLGLLGGGGDE